MSKFEKFIFEDYIYSDKEKLLTLKYSFDGKLNLTETFVFDFEYVDYDKTALDRALFQLFVMAGVSYYKAYPGCEIVFNSGELNREEADFFSEVYSKGLGEFFYTNKLDPSMNIAFPSTREEKPAIVNMPADKLLVGIGGGKDSLVSVEVLTKANIPFASWSLNHEKQLKQLVDRIGSQHFWVERHWDKKLLELNKHDALNGHVPISAILACTGTVVSILAGYSDVVVSNEQSANEPTLEYEGVHINHQYSKSQDFERSYQQLLKRHFENSQRYYSLLRPLSEVRISEIFSIVGFDKYHDVFSSCNRAFTHDSEGLFWDGKCPKCAFVFLALTPFVEQQKLLKLFSGKNLLFDSSLEPTYRQLLGIEGDKPLECVGEVKESRAAMRLSQKIYPELENKYQFQIPDEYNYKAFASHEMPETIWAKIKPLL